MLCGVVWIVSLRRGLIVEVNNKLREVARKMLKGNQSTARF